VKHPLSMIPGRRALHAWTRFWFAPDDPFALHLVRFLTGALLLVWLLLIGGCAPGDDPLPVVESEPASTAEAVAEPEKPALLPMPEKIHSPVSNSLRSRVEAAIRNVRQRQLSTTNAFWTVLHGILGLGPDVTLTDRTTRKRIKALDYICQGGNVRGLKFHTTPFGVEVITTRDGLGQGHQDQFIAEMAQWNMPTDRQFLVHGREFTFEDFIRQSQMQARVTANQELSWTLVIIAQYRGTDAVWTNAFNEKLHFEDLLRAELAAPVETAPCGGTHRLFGLSWAYHLHLQKGGKDDGLWRQVPEKTRHFRDVARRSQNPDGSLSTNFFRSPGNSSDKDLRINTTGHIVEWLALALTDEELRQQWVQDAVNALALMILDRQGAPIDSGSMYHAVHGLHLYHARVFDRKFCPAELLVPLPPGGTLAGEGSK
jgi:hypothetical protein